MRKLFSVRDTLPNKISYYHLLLFLACLSFDRFYCEIIFLSLAIHTIIHLKKEQLKIPRQVWLLQLVWFITILSTFYSADKNQGWAECVKRLPVFLFPLVLFVSSLDINKYRSQLLMGFSLAITITVAYLYSDALSIIKYNKLSLRSLLSSSFLNSNFAEPINMHPTFLSMYIVLSIVYFLSQFYNVASKKEKAFYTLCILLLFAGLIQLSSKSVFIALIIIVVVVFPWLIFQRKIRWKQFLVSGAALLAFVIIMVNTNGLKKRFITDFENDITSDSRHIDKNEYRITRWKVAVQLIKQSPVIGYGTGSEKMLLKEQYFESKFYNSYLHELDAHNQYLSFLMDSGIVGLLIYLYSLCLGFMEAIKKRDMVFISFIILVVVVSFAEDILKANKGIFFYSFFFSFLLAGYYRENKTIGVSNNKAGAMKTNSDKNILNVQKQPPC